MLTDKKGVCVIIKKKKSMKNDNIRVSVIGMIWRIVIFVLYYLFLIMIGVLTIIGVYRVTMLFIHD